MALRTPVPPSRTVIQTVPIRLLMHRTMRPLMYMPRPDRDCPTFNDLDELQRRRKVHIREVDLIAISENDRDLLRPLDRKVVKA